MKILIIDYRSPKGHEEWLKLQIRSLASIDYHVKCIVKEGYGNIIKEIPGAVLFELPLKLYSIKKGLMGRLSYLKVLSYIKDRINEQEWDAVIFTSYEVISLSLKPIFDKAIVVNHNNVSDVETSFIKLLCLQRLPKRFVHVAFNEFIAQKLQQYTKNKVEVVPHGLLKIDYNPSERIMDDIGCKPGFFLFSPSMNSTESNLLREICNSVEFNCYLKKNNLKMIIRTNINIDDKYKDNFCYIDRYLTKDEYYTLFSKSKACIICVGNSFKYRISGTLFECMVLNTPALVSENESLKVYNCFAKNQMFFRTPDELISLLNAIKSDSNNYVSLEKISDPSIAWKDTINKLVKI